MMDHDGDAYGWVGLPLDLYDADASRRSRQMNGPRAITPASFPDRSADPCQFEFIKDRHQLLGKAATTDSAQATRPVGSNRDPDTFSSGVNVLGKGLTRPRMQREPARANCNHGSPAVSCRSAGR
jgi:hypothetical protein